MRVHLFVPAAFGIVGCMAPAPQTLDGKRSDDGSGDVEKPRRPKSSELPDHEDESETDTTSSGMTTPEPSGGAPKDEPPSPEQACFQKCISKNPKTKALEDSFEACSRKCGEDDDVCVDACYDDYNATCNADLASCVVSTDCAKECFPQN